MVPPARIGISFGFRVKSMARFLGAIFLLCTYVQGQEAVIPVRLGFADALRIAEAHNPEFRAARNLVEIAQASTVEARSRPNPEIGVEGEEYSGFWGDNPSFLNGQALIFRLEQEIETAGRRQFRMQLAEADISVSRSEVADARRQLHLEVGRAYFQLALAQADRIIGAEALGKIEQIIDLTQARVDAGEVAGTELRRLKVERLHFVDQVSTYEMAVLDARVSLLRLLGAADLGQPLEAIDEMSAPPLRSPDGRLIATAAEGVVAELAMLRSTAVSNRPDLQAARRFRERADTNIQLQRALRKPNVTVGMGYRRDFGAHAMDFELSIPIPFFADLNPGGVERAIAERRRAVSLVDAAEDTVAIELQKAINAIEIRSQRVQFIEKESLRDLEELDRLIQASYELGETALIDFLDVQREFLTSKQVRNQALYDLRIAFIELAAAAGIPATGGP